MIKNHIIKKICESLSADYQKREDNNYTMSCTSQELKLIDQLTGDDIRNLNKYVEGYISNDRPKDYACYIAIFPKIHIIYYGIRLVEPHLLEQYENTIGTHRLFNIYGLIIAEEEANPRRYRTQYLNRARRRKKELLNHKIQLSKLGRKKEDLPF